jgi:hypothetical protein
MSTRLSHRHRAGQVLAALVAVTALTMTAACGGASAPNTPNEDGTVAGNTPPPPIGYFVSGGLRPMGDQVTVTADGTAVLQTYGKEVARCTLVDAQATNIRDLAQRADLTAVEPSPKATSKSRGADMRATGLLYGEVRVESERANAAAEPWPTLLTSMRAVYMDLLEIRATGSPAGANPSCQ